MSLQRAGAAKVVQLLRPRKIMKSRVEITDGMSTSSNTSRK